MTGNNSSMMKKYKNIDSYINDFPADIRNTLEHIRETIKKIVPDAEEAISYGIPTFKYKGNLVHFAAFKKHISFFPTSSGIREFKDELSSYEISKGTIRFPLDRPLPVNLLKRIIKFRVKENSEKMKTKKNREDKSKIKRIL